MANLDSLRVSPGHAARPALALALALAMAGLAADAAEAIVIRHDVGPSRYEVRERAFPAVFPLGVTERGRRCAATLIHQRWALTAAHCVAEAGVAAALADGGHFPVTLAGRPRQVHGLVYHPRGDLASRHAVDLALLRLAPVAEGKDAGEPATRPIRPMPLYRGDGELGLTVSLLGWGFFGLGTTGRQYEDGRLRRARNRVSGVGRQLRLRFDDPRLPDSDPLPLEGTPALGDSGGPALAWVGDGWQLVGIAIGELRGPDYSEETQGKYGSEAVYERVSRHVAWIESVIGVPLP